MTTTPTVEQILASGVPTGGSVLNPIGVPPGYSATVGEPGVGASLDVPARYYEGDDWAPASLSPEDRARLQRRMAAAGVIPQGSTYRLGIWDDASRGAYRELLSFANGGGLDVEQALAQWAQSKPTADLKPKPYLAPDYATLAQTVKTIVKQRLGGRDASPEELDVLVQRMRGDDRAAYDAGVAADQAFASGDTSDQQQIDPVARFGEFFDQRYKPEIDRRQGIEDMGAMRQRFFGGTQVMDQLIGGSQ